MSYDFFSPQKCGLLPTHYTFLLSRSIYQPCCCSVHEVFVVFCVEVNLCLFLLLVNYMH